MPSKLPLLPRLQSWLRAIPFGKLRSLLLASVAALMLCGCVDYEVGVRFNNQHSGEMTQTVKLGDRLAAINGLSAQQWIDSLDARALKLKGKTQRLSSQEIQVKIPFTTSQNFVQTFNRFFAGQPAAATLAGEPDVHAQVHLDQANWLLILRSHLRLDIDLRSLGISSPEETVLVNPGNLINLDFRLDAPWGATSKLRGDQAIGGEAVPGGMVWHLKPGQINHVEAYFWMPSPLGLSSLGLIGLVVGASYLKQWLEARRSAELRSQTEAKTPAKTPA